MGQISSLFAHKVATAAQSDRAALLRSVGIDPDAPVDPKRMLLDTDYYGLCERAARADEAGHSLTLRVGGSMRCDDYGAFGLAWKSAADLRGAFARAERYGRVLTSVSFYALITEGGRHFMTLLRDGPRRLGMRLSNEQTIAAIAAISREVTSAPFRPEAVFFRHPAPAITTAHEDYFGCPVHFETDRDAIEVSAATLDTPNRLGDHGIATFFDTHLAQEVAGLADARAGLDRQVRQQVSQTLSEGVPRIAEVAQRMGLSGRTLQRRLADQGLAYQDLVETARRDLAEELLARTEYSLAEVAFLTGYAEQSTFARAFKRWHGDTPASFRRTARPH